MMEYMLQWVTIIVWVYGGCDFSIAICVYNHIIEKGKQIFIMI